MNEKHGKGWVALAAGLYLCLALYALYPAWLAPGNAVVGDWQHPDMISNHWLYRWVAERLLAGESLLHNDRYYFPVGDAPWLAGNGSDAVPYTLLAAFIPWPASITAWAILTMVLNGLSAFTLARRVGASGPSATLAGAALAAAPYVAYEMAGARFAQSPLYWFGFFLSAWLALLEDPRPRRAIVAGLLYGATAFTYWYYGLWAAWAGAILFAFRPNFRALGWFLPVALLTTVPPLAVFLSAWKEIPGAEEGLFPHPLSVHSALPFTFPFWGGKGAYQDMIVPLVLTVLPIAGRGHGPRWIWRGFSAVAVLFFMLSLGPSLLLPDGTESAVPGPFRMLYGLSSTLQRFWWPYRHVAPLMLALAPLAALGADGLSATLAPRWKTTLAVILALAIPLEVQVRNGLATVACTWWEAPPVYSRLATLPGEVVLELPLAPSLAFGQQRLSYQWIHGKKLVNGHAPWVDRVRPDAWDQWVGQNTFLAVLERSETGTQTGAFVFTGDDVRKLSRDGLRYLVVNPEYLPGELSKLQELYEEIFPAFFGEPVLTEGDVLVWDLSAYNGEETLEPGTWTPPPSYLSDDTVKIPSLVSVHASGWTTIERSFPAVLPPASASGEKADQAELPDMVRRKLKRREAAEKRAKSGK